MENLVPLGTGNSRLMKSNIPANTTLAQLIQMLNNGTFPYDVGTINPAGISQQGTPLNKDTLLKDATAALYGIGTDAVPDDVLAILGKYRQYWWARRTTPAGEWEYVQSSDRNAYPDSGESGGYEYQYLGVPLDNAVEGPKIATGSYVGTGAYGSKKINILTFEFNPKLVIVTKNDKSDNRTGTILIYNQKYSAGFVGGDSTHSLYLTMGWYPNKVQWFSPDSADHQLNESGMTYFYWAIG